MAFTRQEYWSEFPVLSSRGSSWPRDWTRVCKHLTCIGRWVLYHSRLLNQEWRINRKKMSSDNMKVSEAVIWPCNSTTRFKITKNDDICIQKTYTWMLISALFIIDKHENKPKSSSTNEWINKMKYISTKIFQQQKVMKYQYILPCRWTLKNIMLSERRQWKRYNNVWIHLY